MPSLSKPRSDSTRGSNTGGTSSTIFAGLRDALGHEDGVAGAIGVRDIVADVVHEKHALADVAVREAHAARVARLLIHGHANDAAFGKLCVRKAEERPVRSGVEPCDSVGHVAVVRSANISRFLCLAVKVRARRDGPHLPFRRSRQRGCAGAAGVSFPADAVDLTARGVPRAADRRAARPGGDLLVGAGRG